MVRQLSVLRLWVACALIGALSLAVQPALGKKKTTPPPAPVDTAPPTTAPSESDKQQAVTAALQDYKTASAALAAVAQKAKSDFEASDPMVAALRGLTAAQAAYNAAAAPVLARIDAGHEFTDALAQKQQAKDQIESLQSAGDPPADQITTLAQQEMTATSTARRLESTALAQDPGVAEGKDKLAAAQAAVTNQRQDFQKNLLQNPDYVAAKSAVDEASKKLVAARGALASAN